LKGYDKLPFEERKQSSKHLIENSINNQFSELNEEDMPMI